MDTGCGSEGGTYNGNSNRKKKNNSYHSLQVIQRSKITRVNKYALAKVENPEIKHINSEDIKIDGKNYLAIKALTDTDRPLQIVS